MFPFEKQSEVKKFLDQHKALSLSTIDSEGAVYSAPLYYEHFDFLRFYFVSDRSSVHCVNLQDNHAIAGSVYSEGETISEIEGLQFRGLAKRLMDEESMARTLYLKRYRELGEGTPMYEKFMQSDMFEIKVTWLRWITMDNGKPTRIEGELS